MSSPAVYDAIRSFLEAEFSDAPLHFENEGADPVEGAAWVYVDVRGTLYGQATIGAADQAENRWDEEGQLFLDVNVPSGTGGRKARQLAKSLADLFRGRTLLAGTLEFGDAIIAPSGGDESGNWWAVTVTLEWRWLDAERA